MSFLPKVCKESSRERRKEKKNDSVLRCSAKRARKKREDVSLSSLLPSPLSKTNSYFKAEPSAGVFVYEKRRERASELSEIKVKYAGSLLKAVPEEERGYKAKRQGIAIIRHLTSPFVSYHHNRLGLTIAYLI